MLDSAKSYLAKKATQLGLDRAEALEQAQKQLEQKYPNQTKAKSLHNGVLKVITPNAAVASELRFAQVALLKELNQSLPAQHQISRLHITTQSY